WSELSGVVRHRVLHWKQLQRAATCRSEQRLVPLLQHEHERGDCNLGANLRKQSQQQRLDRACSSLSGGRCNNTEASTPHSIASHSQLAARRTSCPKRVFGGINLTNENPAIFAAQRRMPLANPRPNSELARTSQWT